MKRIVLVGGGTGGHIFPLVSIYQFIQTHKKQSALFSWIGESHSLEQKIALQNEIPFYPIPCAKLYRYLTPKLLLIPFRIALGIGKSFQILRHIRPDVILSKWGYVSLPVCIAARFQGIPVLLHESDAVAGIANRIVGYFAKKIFVNFSEARSCFSNAPVTLISPLLNPLLFSSPNTLPSTPSEKTHLLVLCGSQGSQRIFEFLLAHIHELITYDISIVLGTKNQQFFDAFSKYSHVHVFDFVDQTTLGSLYARSDICITRGSSAIFEMQAFHLHMIIIPLPESGNNHQYKNATIFAKKWHDLLEESRLETDGLTLIQSYIRYKKPSLPPLQDTSGYETILTHIF